MAVVFLFAFTAILVRLFYWQVYKGDELSIKARGQYADGRVLQAPRGEILAADGTWLAARGQAHLVFASLPNLEEGPEEVAEKLAPLFVEKGDDSEKKLYKEIDRLYSLLTRDGAVWVPLKSGVSDEVKRNIEALDIEGIGFESQEMRVYPEGSDSAHLLGFVGKNSEGEDQGYFGLEGYYDISLSGKPGFLSRESDASGIPILLGDTTEVVAIEGVDLKTHVDKRVQVLLDEVLLRGMQRYGAKRGSVIVMDPRDGKVLGMSSYPSYEPAYYHQYGDEYFRNPSVSSTFEPGSIFKVLVMASALDSEVVEPDTKCDICSGPLRVDKYSIETWNQVYHPESTMVDVIVNSDNVGMAFVGKKLGIERMYDYLKKFGIGKLTGIDLQGEVTPELREKSKWSEVDLVTSSFGQGVAVTPIQMVRAVSAIANDGRLVTPQVVDKIMGEGWEKDIEPEPGEKVISDEAANEITAMMVEAAKNGEAKWTHLKEFKVAGKTGTAQIPIAGHYDEDKTIASFIGFAPYDDPQFVMLVSLQEPETSPWASETAAPLWYEIANDLFPYFGVQPEN